MTFKPHFSLATVLATNFGCNWYRVLHAAIWSGCAVELKSEQISADALFQTGSRFQSAALQRTGFSASWFVPISFFSLRDQWIIERLMWATSAALVCKVILLNPSKFLSMWKKICCQLLVRAQNSVVKKWPNPVTASACQISLYYSRKTMTKLFEAKSLCVQSL